ncbi:hypothetical protein DL546_004952 [Coniochaeta pulveracea]|uniref:LysM domain-containing protein n=1 Tax=Coniochaeta pulveracea TaxID=177199 RepID=A0A420Y759_9PEZI|nr:hypothetical protein DL546_004952 [Coniochaeta pulveracea]
MKLFEMRIPALFAATAWLLAVFPAVLADDCAPVTWAARKVKRATTTGVSTSSSVTAKPFSSTSGLASPSGTPLQPGQINCRAYGRTGKDVNYYTCTELADRYEITVDFLFKLNPDLKLDCSNIQPKTEYCVDGSPIVPRGLASRVLVMVTPSIRQTGPVEWPMAGASVPENGESVATCLGRAGTALPFAESAAVSQGTAHSQAQPRLQSLGRQGLHRTGLVADLVSIHATSSTGIAATGMESADLCRLIAVQAVNPSLDSAAPPLDPLLAPLNLLQSPRQVAGPRQSPQSHLPRVPGNLERGILEES